MIVRTHKEFPLTEFGSTRDPVHVARIRTVVCDTGHGRSFVFVVLETDVGIRGVGEASQSGQDAAVVANVEALSHSYVGKNLFELIERQAQGYRSDRLGRAMMVAASGIEIALWDAMGKVLDVPVYQLLGGSALDAVPCYATIAAGVDDHSPSNLGSLSQQLVADGFRGVKVSPFSDWRDRPGEFRWEAGMIDHGVARVAAVRDAIGSEVSLMIECAFRFDSATALRLGRALEPYDCYWLEAPLFWDDPETLAALRGSVPQRLASGELLHGRKAYRGILEANAVDVLQPDVKWTGGILEAKKIAAWAEACQVLVAPHNNSGPIATAASAHLAITLANAVALEVPAVRPDWEADLVGESFPVREGCVSARDLAQRPGLGIDFDDAVGAANASG